MDANLPSAINDLNTLTVNLENHIAKNWFNKIIEVRNYFICSILGFAFKFNSK